MTDRSLPDSAARAQVTAILDRAIGGDRAASEELLPLVYAELRRLAQANMAQEAGRGAGQTLQPTALVHEAYLRLLGPGLENGAEPQWNSRGHFFGAAALAMRRILIERARSRNTAKRGGSVVKVQIDDNAVAVEDGPESIARSTELLALDSALVELEQLDPRAAQVVMLRYFAGLSVEQTAAALDLSPATVKKSWAFARAWLNQHIARQSTDE